MMVSRKIKLLAKADEAYRMAFPPYSVASLHMYVTSGRHRYLLTFMSFMTGCILHGRSAYPVLQDSLSSAG